MSQDSKYDSYLYWRRLRALELALDLYKTAAIDGGEDDILAVADKFFKYTNNGDIGTVSKS